MQSSRYLMKNLPESSYPPFTPQISNSKTIHFLPHSLRHKQRSRNEQLCKLTTISYRLYILARSELHLLLSTHSFKMSCRIQAAASSSPLQHLQVCLLQHLQICPLPHLQICHSTIRMTSFNSSRDLSNTAMHPFTMDGGSMLNLTASPSLMNGRVY